MPHNKDYELGYALAKNSTATLPLTGYRLEGTQEYRDFMDGWNQAKKDLITLSTEGKDDVN